jgi:hypothetical protein
MKEHQNHRRHQTTDLSQRKYLGHLMRYAIQMDAMTSCEELMKIGTKMRHRPNAQNLRQSQ